MSWRNSTLPPTPLKFNNVGKFYMDLLRIESHQLKDNTVNIIQNCDNEKYFVLDKNGWFNASRYFYTLNQCYEYIKQTYGLKLKEVK